MTKENFQTPDLSKLRRVLFWDTVMENIDWQRQRRAVIERVFERGEDPEIQEIIRFYGKEEVNRVLKDKRTDWLAPNVNSIEQYNNQRDEAMKRIDEGIGTTTQRDLGKEADNW